MSSTLKGTLCGIFAAVAYGTNPLFSLNLINMGIDVNSILFYRFAVATALMLAIMRANGRSLRVRDCPYWLLLVAGIVFALSSVTLYQSFLFMDAGIACSILFVYPILVAVFQSIFFHERASLLTYGCIAMALLGIFLLYHGDGEAKLSVAGMGLVVLSSLCYAVYIVGVNHTSLAHVSSGKLTFWVLVAGTLLFVAFCDFGMGIHAPLPTVAFWVNAVGIGLVPTIIPILLINMAIKTIGPTYSAIMGALEPVTALCIGVGVFGETLTVRIAIGALMIFVAVTLIIARPVIKRRLS